MKALSMTPCFAAAALFTAVTFTTAPSAVATVTNCNTPVVINTSGTFTVNTDYEKTGNGTTPCLQVTASNVTLNVNGHTITCKNTTCAPAIQVDSTGAVVKNGTVNGDNGSFSFGVNCNTGTTDCQVLNMYVDNTWTSGVRAAKRVETSVFTNTPVCIESYFVLPAGSGSARYWQNFCQATTTGIDAIGTDSGTPFSIERNVVRMSGTSTGILLDSYVGHPSLFSVIHNIIDASTSIDLPP